MWSIYRNITLLLLVFPTGAFAAGDWKEADSGGLKVAYQDIGAKDAQPLVFIHGWSCDFSFWGMQTEYFSKKYRLILVDLPGFGRSGKPQGMEYTMPFFAGAAKAVLDSAHVQNPVLIGHSMGFAVVRQFLT